MNKVREYSFRKAMCDLYMIQRANPNKKRIIVRVRFPIQLGAKIKMILEGPTNVSA